jgi:hypothetical protein
MVHGCADAWHPSIGCPLTRHNVEASFLAARADVRESDETMASRRATCLWPLWPRTARRGAAWLHHPVLHGCHALRGHLRRGTD